MRRFGADDGVVGVGGGSEALGVRAGAAKFEEDPVSSPKQRRKAAIASRDSRLHHCREQARYWLFQSSHDLRVDPALLSLPNPRNVFMMKSSYFLKISASLLADAMRGFRR